MPPKRMSFTELLRILCVTLGHSDNNHLAILADFRRFLVQSFARPELYYKRSRDAIVHCFGTEHPAVAIANRVLRMTSQEYKASKEAQAVVVKERNKELTVMTYDFICTRVEWLRINNMIIDKIALLMIASGARRCEILRDDIATFLDTQDGKHIKQFGLAKKSVACEVVAVVKPLLFLTPPEFMDMLAEVRASVKVESESDTDEEEMTAEASGEDDLLDNEAYNKQLEGLAKLLWPQFEANGFPCGTHTCRALYANIAHRLHARPSEGLNAFTADVLGHENLASVPHYHHVRVVFAEDPESAHLAANEQLERCHDKLRPVTLSAPNGVTHSFLPMPRRRLNPKDRETLVQNYCDRLALSGIVPTKPIMAAMQMISL